MDQSIIFLFAGIILIGAILLFLICSTKKGTGKLDIEYYRTKCLEIEHQLIPDDLSSYHASVINADKLIDQALKTLRIKGDTMGERMKSTAKLFSDRNGIWTAHKLRNKIAHEPDVKVTYEEARYALKNFRKALKDLGAI